MSKNALLEAPIGSDHTPANGYHAPMDGNGPLRQQAPAPHQWHQPYPPAAPAPTAGRRWMPVAIISAALIIAGALVGGAIIMSRGDKTQTTSATGGSGLAVTAASSTCQAWKTTRAILVTIPGLQPGWDWDTPNIDTLIKNEAAATNAALDRFETEIAAEPADVASAAHEYIAGRRTALKALAERTYTAADGEAGNQALARLNVLCGLPQ